MKDPTPDILRRLERYRDRHDLSDYKLGIMVTGAGNLMKRLREGNVNINTLKKVSKWLDSASSVKAA